MSFEAFTVKINRECGTKNCMVMPGECFYKMKIFCYFYNADGLVEREKQMIHGKEKR